VDPNLFRLDWEQVAEVLAAVVILSFIVERALALLFESNVFVDSLGSKGVKEPIALGFSFLICWYWKVDLLSVVLHGDKTRFLGMLVTAAVIAGGSKASLKLFRDVLGIENEHAYQKRKGTLGGTVTGGGGKPAPKPE
jgi:hypothetical protein